MPELDITKPIRTILAGLPARIICSDRKGNAPYIVLVERRSNGTEDVRLYEERELHTVFENIPVLPDKPSALLRVALSDLAKVEQDIRYKVDMSSYHVVRPGGICHVCLAGAVMAKSLKVPFVSAIPARLPESDEIYALEQLRVGELHRALLNLDLPIPNDLPKSVPVTTYETDRDRFFDNMHTIANLLEMYGL